MNFPLLYNVECWDLNSYKITTFPTAVTSPIPQVRQVVSTFNYAPSQSHSAKYLYITAHINILAGALQPCQNRNINILTPTTHDIVTRLERGDNLDSTRFHSRSTRTTFKKKKNYVYHKGCALGLGLGYFHRQCTHDNIQPNPFRQINPHLCASRRRWIRLPM